MERSGVRGRNTSAVKVTGFSERGFSLLVGGREVFMSYADFPWFKDAPKSKVLNVEEPSPGHLYWPDLDIDLSAEILDHPEKFPLKSV